jgi:hypothetical protein
MKYLKSYDALISQHEFQEAECDFFKHFLEQVNKKDYKLWEIVEKFEHIYIII